MQRSVHELVRIRLQNERAFTQEQTKERCCSSEIKNLKGEIEDVPNRNEHQIQLMQIALAKCKEEIRLLNLDMDKKREDMRIAYLEFEDLRKEYHRLEEESARMNEETQEKLRHKESMIKEYQTTVAEQRTILEKKQLYISKLEHKVRDLMFEIRSLLQLEKSPQLSEQESKLKEEKPFQSAYYPANAFHTPYDLSQMLGRYIEKAEQITGADHLGYVGGKSPRFLDLSLECYAIDRRRLCDHFRDETNGILFIYSPLDKKFLFVNQHVKTLIGWSPEKFMKDFRQLTVNGYTDWEETLRMVKRDREGRVRLSILSRSGHPSRFECYLGLIAKGPFANHVLGILAIS